MASFRPLGQFVQFFLDDGTVNAGGAVTFYETDLTTLKNTYSDPGLTVLNPNPLPLDAAGRPSNDCWGSGVYGCVLKDALGTTIQTLNNVQSGADPGLVIPSLVTGDFLTNDGSNLLWDAIRQVPDPTGLNGYILGTDGTLVLWQALSSLNIPTIEQTGNALTLGPMKIQWGTGSAPTTGFRQVFTAVTYGVAFSAPAVYVGVMPTSNSVCVGQQLPVPAITSNSASSFTVQFDSDDFGETNAVFTSPVPFMWFAIGAA
jgi:hypothetical protein